MASSKKKKKTAKGPPTDLRGMRKWVEDLLDPGQGEGGIQAGDQLYRAMKAGLVDPAQLKPQSSRAQRKKGEPITHVKSRRKRRAA